MKTCLVLGAGATLANALHFRAQRMRHTRPPLDTTFFETIDARKVALGENLLRYFRDRLGIDPTPTTLREFRMEQIFADVAYDFREGANDKLAFAAYVELVDLYLRVLQDTTNWLCAENRTGGPIGRMLATLAKTSDELTILTFNHDLVIENELQRRITLRQRWCLDSGYGTLSGDLTNLYPTTPRVPVFQLHEDNGCDHSRPITLLKLHGSLNWMIRLSGATPTANFLASHGGTAPLQLVTGRSIQTRQPTFVREPGARGRQAWNMWPIVVPPVYGKQQLKAGALQKTWDDARHALAEADSVTFFGYSLPELDIEAEKMFERALTRNTTCRWIDVINPSPPSAARFAGLSPALPVRWYPSIKAFNDLGSSLDH